MDRPLRILLVDDHVLFRNGVAVALTTRPDFQMVGEANDGVEAVALARESQPDIVLMDIAMPRCNGLEATRLIKREKPNVRIIILTVSDHDEDLYEAIKSGAQGYLTKDLKAQVLLDTIDVVARGEVVFSGAVAARILQEFDEHREGTSEKDEMTDKLSAREIQVLELLAQGQSNSEIAGILGLSESTVKNHLRTILDKLHLRNRVQAAVYAVQQGLMGEH